MISALSILTSHGHTLSVLRTHWVWVHLWLCVVGASQALHECSLLCWWEMPLRLFDLFYGSLQGLALVNILVMNNGFEFWYLVEVVGNYEAFFDMVRKRIILDREALHSGRRIALIFHFIRFVFFPEKCGLFWLKISSLYKYLFLYRVHSYLCCTYWLCWSHKIWPTCQ